MTNILNCQRNLRRWYKNDVIPPQACLDNPLNYVLALTKTERKLFNALVYHINKYENCYPSQETIGRWIGIGRQQTNVLIGKLVALGLLMKQKCYDDTSLYRLPKFFHRKEVVEVLKPFITAFNFMKDVTLSVVNLLAKKQPKNENTTSILMPLSPPGYIYISSPCHSLIEEGLSPGDSAKRNCFLTTMQEEINETQIPEKNYLKLGRYEIRNAYDYVKPISSSMKFISKRIESRLQNDFDKNLNLIIPLQGKEE